MCRVRYLSGPPVRFFAARNRARDADKLGAHLIGRQADLRVAVSSQIDELEVRSDPSESIRPSARSAHRSQLGKAGLERAHQRVDLRFSHRRGECARPRADDDATFVVEVIEQRLESARVVGL